VYFAQILPLEFLEIFGVYYRGKRNFSYICHPTYSVFFVRWQLLVLMVRIAILAQRVEDKFFRVHIVGRYERWQKSHPTYSTFLSWWLFLK